MNFEQSPYYRQPKDQIAPPTQSAQAPAEGADPASIIAARSAAVMRNRQKSERAALLRDIVRIIGVIILLGGVGWIAHTKHQQTLAEERLQARNKEAERMARAEERAAYEAKAAELRKERQQAKEAAEAELLKRKAEERAKAEELRVQKENVKRYNAAMDRFRGAVLDLLASAPASDVPTKVVNETWFSCLVPGGRTGLALYEIRALPGKKIHVSLLDSNGKVEEIKAEDFLGVISKSAFLLSKGTFCYYSPIDKGRWELRMPVPVEGEKKDPSLEDFRDLHEIVRKLGISVDSFGYEVYLREVGGVETRILVVPFGGKLTRAAVRNGLQSVSATQNGRGSGEAAIRERLNDGSLIIRRKGVRR